MNKVLAFLSFFVRPGILLLIGLGAGYWLGYSDAFRNYDTLGDKVGRVVYKVHPAAVSAGVQQRASAIRDTVQTRSGVNGLPPD